MGINSERKIKWTLSIGKNISHNSYTAAANCANEIIKKNNGIPRTAIVLNDGLKGDGVGIVNGISSVMKDPFAGGTTGDDRKFKRGYIIANREALQDTVAILAKDGDIKFAINADSGWKPIGSSGKVTNSSGNTVRRIDGKSAIDFFTEQIGSLPEETELAMFPLAVFDEKERFILRAPMKMNKETGEIIVAGKVEEGRTIEVTHASIDDILSRVNDVLEPLEKIIFDPAAVLIFSCAARKWILGKEIQSERKRLYNMLQKDIPTVGFSTFGEIAPFKGDSEMYSKTYFHNETLVLFLLGEGQI